MKKNLSKIGFMALILAASTLAFTACNKKAASTESTEMAESDSIVIVEEIPETKDYSAFTFEQKNEVIADAKAELDVLNKKIDDLKAEAKDTKKELSADVKSNYEKAIKDLEKSRDEYKQKVDALEKSTAETWEAAKTDIANAYNTAAQGIEKTLTNTKSKVTGAVEDAKEAVNKGIDSLQNKILK